MALTDRHLAKVSTGGGGSGRDAAAATDHLNPCSDTATATDEAEDKWPPDFDDNQVINIVDLNGLLPPPLGAWGQTCTP